MCWLWHSHSCSVQEKYRDIDKAELERPSVARSVSGPAERVTCGSSEAFLCGLLYVRGMPCVKQPTL